MDVEHRISELEIAHHELATVVWGDDRIRDNGLRARVNKMEGVEIPAIQSSIREIKGCVDEQGKKIDGHLKDHNNARKDDAAIRAEKIKTYGMIIATLIGQAATIATVLLTRGK